MLSSIKWSALLPPLFLFLVTLGIYLHNLSPSVYGGDVGDVITASAVFGVAHPSGYPLFTLLGILFNYLPIDQTPAWKVGLTSAVSSAAAVVVLYLLVFRLMRNRLLALISALTMAFYYTFWLYAEVAEFFALNNLFYLVLIYLSVSYYITKKRMFLYLLSFFLGLSLSHHHIVTLLFPTIGLFVLATNWRVILQPIVLFKCLFFLLVGLLPYIYIPIAASRNPPINWDNASSLQNFIHLVLRLDYGVRPGVTIDHYTRLLTVKTYAGDLFAELTPPVIVLSFLGFIQLLREKKQIIALLLFLGFFISGPFFISYTGTPIQSAFTFGVLERFYMISALFLFILFPFGIKFFLDLLMPVLKRVSDNFKKKKNLYATLFTSVFLFIPVTLFQHNFQKTDLHDIWIGDYFAEDVLVDLPQESAVFLAGDTVLFNTLYLQYARDKRKDVLIMNVYGLDKNTVYQKQKELVKKRYPKLPAEELELRVITSFNDDHPLYSIVGIQHSKQAGKQIPWIPSGLLYKFATEEEQNMTNDEFISYQDKKWAKLHIKDLVHVKRISQKSLTLSDISTTYSQAAVNTANYLVSKYHDLENAKRYYEYAILLYPDSKSGYYGLGYYYLNKKSCNNAAEYFTKAHSLDRTDRTIYMLLYVTYDSCLGKKEKAAAIASQYKSIFKKNLLEDLKDKTKEIF